MNQPQTKPRTRLTGSNLLFLYVLACFVICPANVLGEQRLFGVVEDTKGITTQVSNIRSQFSGDELLGWRGGALVNIRFDKICSIEVISYDRKKARSEVAITFRDGTQDNFRFQTPHLHLRGESRYGQWNKDGLHLRRLTFTNKAWEIICPQVGASAGVELKHEVDQVLLKNGDVLSGIVEGDSFAIKASYGAFRFHKATIQEIQFEGGEENMDYVILKIGDKISGVVQEQQIAIKTTGGPAVQVAKEEIQSIVFAE